VSQELFVAMPVYDCRAHGPLQIRFHNSASFGHLRRVGDEYATMVNIGYTGAIPYHHMNDPEDYPFGSITFQFWNSMTELKEFLH